MKRQFFQHGLCSLFSQLHHVKGFLLIRFADRIFQQRAAVADLFFPHLLRPVQMSERHIVKSSQNGDIHIIDPAHAQHFRIARLRTDLQSCAAVPPCVKLMREKDISLCKINLFPVKHRLYGRRIVLRQFSAAESPHIPWFQEGEQVEVHFSVRILQRYFPQMVLFCLRRFPGNIDLMGAKQSAGVIQPLR